MPCHWDADNKQILSALCMHCKDPDFTPIFEDMENVGCCRYEPVFTLFEIYKMASEGESDFFLQQIYHHPNRRVYPYEIVIGARIDQRFNRPEEQENYKRWLNNPSTRYRAEDLRLKYATCSFFLSGQGCRLPPHYKTSICRSFVCHTIEDQVSEETRQHLQTWQRNIIDEAEKFNRYHRERLQKKGLNLVDHVSEILQYFTQMCTGGLQE